MNVRAATRALTGRGRSGHATAAVASTPIGADAHAGKPGNPDGVQSITDVMIGHAAPCS